MFVGRQDPSYHSENVFMVRTHFGINVFIKNCWYQSWIRGTVMKIGNETIVLLALLLSCVVLWNCERTEIIFMKTFISQRACLSQYYGSQPVDLEHYHKERHFEEFLLS